jgi:hypothetical protein
MESSLEARSKARVSSSLRTETVTMDSTWMEDSTVEEGTSGRMALSMKASSKEATWTEMAIGSQ